MLEEHLEWANASYYHSSEGTVNSNGGFNRYPITPSNPFFTGCEYAILRHSCDDRFGKMLFDGRERAIYDQKGKKDR